MALVYRRASIISGLVIAGTMVAQGAVMVAASSDSYRSGSFSVAFDLFTRVQWAMAFILSGTIYVLIRRPIATAPMVFTSAAWSLSLLAAVINGDAGSPTAWISWGCISILIAVMAARGGK